VSHVIITGIVEVRFSLCMICDKNTQLPDLDNWNISAFVCRIEISHILFCLMLTFKLATVLTVDELRRLMTSVGMLVYLMERLMCFTIFKVIMLIKDNRTCCVLTVDFLCFMIFYVCCYLLYAFCLLLLRSCVKILLKNIWTIIIFMIFIFLFQSCFPGFCRVGFMDQALLIHTSPNVSNYTACVKNWCIVH
jgi:hypothetical protein